MPFFLKIKGEKWARNINLNITKALLLTLYTPKGISGGYVPGFDFSLTSTKKPHPQTSILIFFEPSVGHAAIVTVPFPDPSHPHPLRSVSPEYYFPDLHPCPFPTHPDPPHPTNLQILPFPIPTLAIPPQNHNSPSSTLSVSSLGGMDNN